MKKEPEPANELNRIQQWMMTIITHPEGVYEGANADEAMRWIDCGGGQLESVVTRSRKLSASERLAIYGNAYYARLLDCLGEVYPILKRTLGPEVFDGFAFSYLQEYPSHSYTLHHLGEEFVAFLNDSKPTMEEESGSQWGAFLVDLARLEWGIYEVFDGEGLERSHPFSLAGFQAEGDEWLNYSFQAAPCLRLLDFGFPVNDFYSRVRASEEALDLSFPAPGEYFVALSRRNYVVQRFPINRAQFLLLNSLVEGMSVGDALGGMVEALGDSIGEYDLEVAIPQWFRQWAAEQCFFAQAPC